MRKFRKKQYQNKNISSTDLKNGSQKQYRIYPNTSADYKKKNYPRFKCVPDHLRGASTQFFPRAFVKLRDGSWPLGLGLIKGPSPLVLHTRRPNWHLGILIWLWWQCRWCWDGRWVSIHARWSVAPVLKVVFTAGHVLRHRGSYGKKLLVLHITLQGRSSSFAGTYLCGSFRTSYVCSTGT